MGILTRMPIDLRDNFIMELKAQLLSKNFIMIVNDAL